MRVDLKRLNSFIFFSSLTYLSPLLASFSHAVHDHGEYGIGGLCVLCVMSAMCIVCVCVCVCVCECSACRIDLARVDLVRVDLKRLNSFTTISKHPMMS